MSNQAVIYNTSTGMVMWKYATLAAAKAAYTRAAKAKMLGETVVFGNRRYGAEDVPPVAVMPYDEWRETVNRKYVGARGYEVDLDTPTCCDPNSETYWSM